MANPKMRDEGVLIVQVYTADEAMPIENANVIVSKTSENGEELVRVLKTNRSGKTEPLALFAPPAENSLTPENPARYSVYNIRVDFPGFYTMENLDVPIFGGETAIQPVALIPLPLDGEQGKKITVVEREPNL